MLKTIAIIPARGGSKRLPRKNILVFGGKPMLAWTCEAATESGLFDRIIVSTDDDEIAAAALLAKANVLRRPAAVSNDAATLTDVIHHALTVLEHRFGVICLLLPNCPLRNAQDIIESARVYRQNSPSALLSVVSYGWTPPFRAQRLIERRLQPLFTDWSDSKSQQYPHTVCASGAIYWSSGTVMRHAKTLYVEGIEGFQMPWYRGVDIDTAEDLELAACIRHSLDTGFRFSQ